MNLPEAKEILARQIERLKSLPLEGLVRHGAGKKIEAKAVVGKYGRTYRLKIESFWNDADLKVRVAIDDGGLRAFFPLVEEFHIPSKDLICQYKVHITNSSTISYMHEHIEAEIHHEVFEMGSGALARLFRSSSKTSKSKRCCTRLLSKTLKVKRENKVIQPSDKERKTIINRIKVALVNMDHHVKVDGKI